MNVLAECEIKENSRPAENIMGTRKPVGSVFP